MKNFGSILTFIAISAGVVSGRALPSSGDSIAVRAPSVPNVIFSREPKKGKAAANGTASAAGAVTSATGAKKAGKKAGAANATAAAVDSAAVNSTAAAGAKKGKVSLSDSGNWIFF